VQTDPLEHLPEPPPFKVQVAPGEQETVLDLQHSAVFPIHPDWDDSWLSLLKHADLHVPVWPALEPVPVQTVADAALQIPKPDIGDWKPLEHELHESVHVEPLRQVSL